MDKQGVRKLNYMDMATYPMPVHDGGETDSGLLLRYALQQQLLILYAKDTPMLNEPNESSCTTQDKVLNSVNCKSLYYSFFDWMGVAYYEFMPQGTTVNNEYYLQQFARRNPPETSGFLEER
ncbi:hypothetical protein J6590_101405 [Homalodisca vitripennis]|nr:hypothetical protein J6590_101405 [Homalodisca vitripennis]